MRRVRRGQGSSSPHVAEARRERPTRWSVRRSPERFARHGIEPVEVRVFPVSHAFLGVAVRRRSGPNVAQADRTGACAGDVRSSVHRRCADRYFELLDTLRDVTPQRPAMRSSRFSRRRSSRRSGSGLETRSLMPHAESRRPSRLGRLRAVLRLGERAHARTARRAVLAHDGGAGRRAGARARMRHRPHHAAAGARSGAACRRRSIARHRCWIARAGA